MPAEGDAEGRRVDDLPRLLGARQLACAESCTAGGVAQELAAVGEAADWFAGSLVAYQTAVKRRLLQVEAPSVVSADAAEEMARGAAALFEADVALATTGVLGEQPVDGVAPGTVIVATLVDGEVRTCEYRVHGPPDAECDLATRHACLQLVDHLRHGARSGPSPTVAGPECSAPG